MNEARVRQVLKEVKERVTGRDVVALGMVKRTEVQGDTVTLGLDLPAPVYRHREDLARRVEEALRGAGAARVVLEMGVNVPPGTRGAATRLPGVKNVVAVAAGKGGVGKSTVATCLALSLKALGARVGLLDADIYGPSVPTMLGPPDKEPEAKSGHRIVPAQHHGIHVISVGFFTERDGAVIWRGPMVHKLLQQFLEDVEWGELDYLVVDLPPGTGDAQLSLSQLIPITGAVLVTTPQEVSLIDVEKAASMFRKVEVPVLGVVENMSFYLCPACGHREEIFSRGGGRQLAQSLKVEFLGEIPLDSRVRQGGDIGRPVVVAQPEGEHGQLFREVAFRLSEAIMKLVLSGPRRPAGLVQIK